MNRHVIPLLFLLALALATPPGCTTTADDDFGGDDDAGDDDVDCTGYRTAYPDEETGTGIGDVLADFPGMVDRDGVTQRLEQYHLDTSLLVLVVINAFDS